MKDYTPIEILIIEDNEGDIELAKFAFKKAEIKCNISIAYDGQEGIEYIRKENSFKDAVTPDLILLDINMPIMDGKEFLDVIKKDENMKAIPIIMLTSSDAENDINEAYKKYANSYIMKPIGLDELVNIAKRIEDFWINLSKLPKNYM